MSRLPVFFSSGIDVVRTEMRRVSYRKCTVRKHSSEMRRKSVSLGALVAAAFVFLETTHSKTRRDDLFSYLHFFHCSACHFTAKFVFTTKKKKGGCRPWLSSCECVFMCVCMCVCVCVCVCVCACACTCACVTFSDNRLMRAWIEELWHFFA